MLLFWIKFTFVAMHSHCFDIDMYIDRVYILRAIKSLVHFIWLLNSLALHWTAVASSKWREGCHMCRVVLCPDPTQLK